MNLVSPWMGGNLMPMPAWLGLNPIAGFTYVGGPGQYEGFNYLGLGVLLLIALNAMGLVRSVGRHKALFALLLLFSVYALSSNVMLGGRTFFEFKYPESLSLLTSQFRASGRFFWLVGYVLLVASLYKTYQILQSRHFIGVCLLIVLIQVVDLQGVYQGLNFRLQRVDAPRITTEQWDAALGKDVSVVYAYPKFKCGKDPQNSLLPLMKYASERQLKLNTGYIARYTPDCLDMNAEVANSNPAVSAYVFSSDALQAGTTANSIFPKPWTVRCQFIDFAQVCRVTDWKTKP
jgi:hypothetical protein